MPKVSKHIIHGSSQIQSLDNSDMTVYVTSYHEMFMQTFRVEFKLHTPKFRKVRWCICNAENINIDKPAQLSAHL